MKKANVPYRNYRESYKSIEAYPFSSARKRMSTIIENNGEQ